MFGDKDFRVLVHQKFKMGEGLSYIPPVTCVSSHDFQKCHSKLDSCPFDLTLVSAASSVQG